MRRLLIAVLLCAFGSGVEAAGREHCVRAEVERVFAKTAGSSKYPAVVLTLTNICGRTVKYVSVNCVWLSSGSPIADQSYPYSNLRPSAPITKELWTYENHTPFDSAKCVVEHAV